MERFKAVFFEEGAEAIDAIENNLLGMDSTEEVDSETINDIFRAAHSLKGGSATFGMLALTEFTHVMETLLDKIRAGEMSLTQDIVDCLFSSLDILRNLVAHYQFEDEINQNQMILVRNELESLLTGDHQTDLAPAAEVLALKSAEEGAAEDSAEDSSAQQTESQSASGNVWTIKFAPHSNIMDNGNDPLRFIEELTEFGELEVQCDASKLPDFDSLEPTSMHLSWDITLKANKPIVESDITDVFMWVEDECDLTITNTGGASVSADSGQESSSPEAAEPEAETPVASVEAPVAAAAPEPQAPAPVAAAAKESKGANKGGNKQRNTQSIRVDLDKIDSLINLIGELVITQSMLSVFGDEEKYPQFERLSQGLGQLERHTRDLQEGVMRVRMLPISFCFSRFPRMVRDLGKKLDKDLAVEIIGETTEVDKTVIEELTDPMVHLVRNSVDHGIEMPEERIAKGKPATGTISLEAYHQVGNIIIEISDDGAGLNTERIRNKAISSGIISEQANLTEQEIHELIFAPGFSTADSVTDLSGRGVGMDVVKRNIQSLGGIVDVRSVTGEGTTFTIRLPLTLAILDGQLVKVGDETYIIPILAVIESIQLDPSSINRVGDMGVTFKWRGDYIPIIHLSKVFGCPPAKVKKPNHGLVVVVESDNQRFGIYVDELTSQQQVVVKSLEANYTKVEDLSGATILGDGSVALIIDVASLLNRIRIH